MRQTNLLAPQQTPIVPDYTLHIPAHVRNILAVCILGGLFGIGLIFLLPENLRVIAYILLAIGIISSVLASLLMLVMSNRKRLQARQTILDKIAWRGDEVLLDVGCGNGFLILQAAKRLPRGKAIGIDMWVEGSGAQNADIFWRNAQLEGVMPQVELKNSDARRMPFEAETFDVIVSSLALHHMGSNADREQAFHEMIRVLKPGGSILLYDMFPMIGQAATVLRQNHFNQVKRLHGVVMVILSATK